MFHWTKVKEVTYDKPEDNQVPANGHYQHNCENGRPEKVCAVAHGVGSDAIWAIAAAMRPVGSQLWIQIGEYFVPGF